MPNRDTPPPASIPGREDMPDREDMHDAVQAARPQPRHRIAGLAGGISAFFLIAVIGPPDGISQPAWFTLGIAALMAVWWATEALPLAATALVPLVAFPLLDIHDFRSTAASYAHPLIFLFMGGFLVAQAMQRWDLHRRMALSIAVRAGAEPRNLIAGFMAATAFLSMWVSNTATTIMMLPIAASVVSVVLLNSPHVTPDNAQKFGLSTMLAIAYAASIGGIGTLVGTPPNALFAAFFAQEFGIEVSFAAWMVMAMPVVIIMLPLVWLVLTRLVYPFDLGRTSNEAEHGQQVVRAQLDEMGSISAPERRVAMVFAAMAMLWLSRPLLDDFALLSGLTDSGIAIAGALALFLLPAGPSHRGGEALDRGTRLLDWDHAKRISWDVLILFGGGLALAGAFSHTGLATALGEGLGTLSWLPLIIFVLTVAAMVIFLTELTSNTATVAALLPVIAAIAQATGHSPLVLSIAAVMAASCAFMLPVATPPNAIVFASGYVTVPQMMRAGFMLNIAGIVLITLLATFLAPLVFGN